MERQPEQLGTSPVNIVPLNTPIHTSNEQGLPHISKETEGSSITNNTATAPLSDDTDKNEDNRKLPLASTVSKLIAEKYLVDEDPIFDVIVKQTKEQNPVRRICMRMLSSKKFENVIICLIIANSFVLALTDYRFIDEKGFPSSVHSTRNAIVEKADLKFTLAFTIEMLIKIIAMGFVSEKGTYLRDPWNILDFIVVVSSLTSSIPEIPNVSVLRTLRVLRPLRSVSVIPGMRRIVSSLLKALPALFNVVVLQVFVFAIFGILGIQLFSGRLHARCRLTPFPIKLPLNESGHVVWPVPQDYSQRAIAEPSLYRCLEANNYDLGSELSTKSSSPWSIPQPCYWPLDLDDTLICSLSGSGKHFCPSDRWCGSHYDGKGNARFTSELVMQSTLFTEDFNWGYTTFDNIGRAFLTIFQAITKEGWVKVLYMCQDASTPLIASMFFISLILFGSFFLLNLTLAVICDEFEVEEEHKEAPVRRLGVLSLVDRVREAAPVKFLYDVAINPRFTSTITFMIVLNTVILAMDHHPISGSLEGLLEMFNFALSCVFIVEFFVKILGLGVKQYATDKFNLFDAFIVVVGVVEFMIARPSFMTDSNDAGGGGALSALRTFRLFRIFKLARQWISLRVLLQTIVQTLGSVMNFGILLILFIYIYSLIGLQLFANKFRFDEDGYALPLGDPQWGVAEIPRSNFDDLLTAFVTIFHVLTGENWNNVMYDAWRSSGWPATIFFVSLVVMGNFIMMNLFLAILLGNFQGNEEISKPLPSPSAKTKVEEMEETGIKDFQELVTPPATTSLYYFKQNNPIRVFCYKLVYHPNFDDAVLALIFVSSIALALDNPLNDPASETMKWLNILDYVLSGLFFIEMSLKILVMGFIGHSGAYLRNSWNILDFIIVVSSVLMILADGNPAFKALRSLRALRTFRPLRMISRQPGLKLVVNALFESIPSVINVAFICVLFFLIFSIVGVNYFKGTFNACQGDVFDSLSSERQSLLTSPVSWVELNPEQRGWFANTSCYQYENIPTSKVICNCWNATWDKAIPQSFDNVGVAMLTLFEISTTEGWVNVMFQAVDKTDIDMQPIRDNNVAWVWFFVAFMVVGSFFVMNLFVGVIIDNFNRMKAQFGKNAFLTDEQAEWVMAQESTLRLRPLKLLSKPEKGFRLEIWMLVQNPKFEAFIMLCIVLNTLIMSAEYFGQSDAQDQFASAFNFLLAIIFTFEALLKIIAMRFQYFDDMWNRFDICVVVGTATGYVLEVTTGNALGSVAQIVRTLRISRIFRLINGAKGLKHVFVTLYVALPGLSNIASLLFLLLFIFAIMGVQLYSKIAFSDYVNTHVHFRDFWTAMIFLLRASTGEDWNGVMHSLAASTTGCVADPEYDSNVCGFNDFEGCIPLNGCGNPSIYIYMLFFTLLVTYVMLNLSIAVILEGFSDSDEKENPYVDENMLKDFQMTWAQFDPKATSFMSSDDFFDFLNNLSPPMGLKGTNPSRRSVLKYSIYLAIPLYEDASMNFRDVLYALTKFYMANRNPFLKKMNNYSADVNIHKKPLRKKRSSYTFSNYLAVVIVQRSAKKWLQLREKPIEKDTQNMTPVSSLKSASNTELKQNKETDISSPEEEKELHSKKKLKNKKGKEENNRQSIKSTDLKDKEEAEGDVGILVNSLPQVNGPQARGSKLLEPIEKPPTKSPTKIGKKDNKVHIG